MTDISAIHAFDKWWNTQPEPHISAPKQCHVGMQQERMMTIWMVAFEAGRQQGMRQERALWNLSESTQEFESFDRTASHMAGEYVAHKELNDGGEPVKNATYWKRQHDDLLMKLNTCAIKVSELEKKSHPAKDREADRLRFSDESFNRWLDEGISDSGHTVYDLVENVCEAWHGWENSQYYTHPHHDNLGLAESIIKQQQLKIDNLLENNTRLDAEIEVLKTDNDKLTEALLKANRVYDFDNPLLDKELEK